MSSSQEARLAFDAAVKRQAEAKAKCDQYRTELTELVSLSETRSLTDGERERMQRITKASERAVDEYHEAKAEAGRAAVAYGEAVPGAIISGDGTKGAPQFMRRLDPWDSEQGSIFDRALAAAESSRNEVPDYAREKATVILERARRERDDAMATWAVAASMPAYRSAFEKVLALGPSIGAASMEPEEAQAYARVNSFSRAMNEGTTAAGGAMVPFALDPAIVITNQGVINPIRRLASIKTIATNAYHGVASAGITAEMISEATEVADGSPTLSQPSITVYKADCYVQASYELYQDVREFSTEVMRLMADAKDRLEASKFTLGTGTSEPRGIITATSNGGYTVAGTSGAANAADLVIGDAYAVENALPVRHHENASWLAHPAIFNKIRQLTSGSAGYNMWADIGPGIPPTLIGHPTYKVSDMDSTIVSGSTDQVLYLGDVSRYYVVDRVGPVVAVNDMVVGSNRRPTGERGLLMWWRFGGDCIDSSSGRLLVL